MLSDMATKLGSTRMLISESQNEAMLGNLHAFLSIYGWLGMMGCGTQLAWQAVYGGWAVNMGDIRFPNSPRVSTPTGLTFNTTEAAAYRAICAQNLVAGNVLGAFSLPTCDEDLVCGCCEITHPFAACFYKARCVHIFVFAMHDVRVCSTLMGLVSLTFNIREVARTYSHLCLV